MARLSEQEKQELLTDARSLDRKREFDSLRKRAESTTLSPNEYLEFLKQAQLFMKEDASKRPPISGDTFLL